MDDVLLAYFDKKILQQIFLETQKILELYGLIITTAKVQIEAPYQYLGYILNRNTIPQKTQIQIVQLKTLNSFQELLSDINWLCSTLKVKSLSRVWIFATPWTVAYQVSPSIGFSRQEYWSELPFPSPGDLPDPGIELGSPSL